MIKKGVLKITERILFWIFTTFSTFITSILYNHYSNIKRNEKNEAKSIKSGLISLLKSEIIKTHEKCFKKGICTIYEMELIEDIYKNYTQLGGNGCAKKLINDLKKLPIKHFETKKINNNNQN